MTADATEVDLASFSKANSPNAGSAQVAALAAPPTPSEDVRCNEGDYLMREASIVDPDAYDRIGKESPGEAVQEKIDNASKSRDKSTQRLADKSLRYEEGRGGHERTGTTKFFGRRNDGSAAVSISVRQGGSTGRWLVNGLSMCQPPSGTPAPKTEDPIVKPSCDGGETEYIGPGTATDRCDKEDTGG